MILTAVRQVKRNGTQETVDAKLHVSAGWEYLAIGPMWWDDGSDEQTWAEGLTNLMLVHPHGEMGKQYMVRESPEQIKTMREAEQG